MKKKNFYDVLGVGRQASEAEIKRAFRRLAQKYHPDSSGAADSGALFKQISEAYAVLSMRAKRAAYDRTLDAADKRLERVSQYRRNQQRSEADKRKSPERPRRAPLPLEAHKGPDISRWLRKHAQTLFKKRPAKQTAERRATNGDAKVEEHTVNIAVTVEEAILGTTKALTFSYRSGAPRQMKVKLPPGVNDGAVLAVRCAARGAFPAAALKVRVTLQEHAWLALRQNDVIVKLPVTIGEAVTGAAVEVPGLRGPLRISLPPGTSSGSTIRISGEGIRNARTKTVGDLCVVPMITLPEKGGAAVKAAAAAIEAHYLTPVRRHLPTQIG